MLVLLSLVWKSRRLKHLSILLNRDLTNSLACGQHQRRRLVRRQVQSRKRKVFQSRRLWGKPLDSHLSLLRKKSHHADRLSLHLRCHHHLKGALVRCFRVTRTTKTIHNLPPRKKLFSNCYKSYNDRLSRDLARHPLQTSHSSPNPRPRT